MKKSCCIVSLDHLQQNEEIRLLYELDPAFLDLSIHDEAQPSKPVFVEGACSLVDDYVLVNVRVRAFFSLRCAFCNEPFEYEVSLDHYAHQERVESLRTKEWDLSEHLRESILLELPFFPQCGGKVCLHRDEIQKYFSSRTQKKDEQQQFPFENFFT